MMSRKSTCFVTSAATLVWASGTSRPVTRSRYACLPPTRKLAGSDCGLYSRKPVMDAIRGGETQRAAQDGVDSCNTAVGDPSYLASVPGKLRFRRSRRSGCGPGGTCRHLRRSFSCGLGYGHHRWSRRGWLFRLLSRGNGCRSGLSGSRRRGLLRSIIRRRAGAQHARY